MDFALPWWPPLRLHVTYHERAGDVQSRLPGGIFTPKLTSKLGVDGQSRRGVVGKFAAREWPRVPIGIFLGALLAIARKLVLDDAAFRLFVSQRWQTSALNGAFSGFVYYQREIYTVILAAATLVLIRYLPALGRIVRSWIEGVVSGLTVIWGICTFYCFATPQPPTKERLAGTLVPGALLTLVSLGLHIRGASQRAKGMALTPYSTPAKPTIEEHFRDFKGDSPIEKPSQDLLNRSGVVDWLAVTLVELQAPVIALEGDYGDGKTSVLNL